MSDFIAVKGKIDTEIDQAVLDFQDIKNSMYEIGLDTEDKKTCEYGSLIVSVKPTLDKVPVLEAEVEELTTQNNGLIASNEELQTENEVLTASNTELITQVNDLTNTNEELTDQVDTLTEQSAENNDIIDDAILAVEEKGGTVDDKSQLPTAIRAIEGVILNDLYKFFIDGYYDVDTWWDKMVTEKVIGMHYMLLNASLTGGNTYLFDLTNCLTQESVSYIFSNTGANGGDVNIQIRLGANNTTLYAMMYNKLVNTYGWNISFTDDTDCSGLNVLCAGYRQNKIASIDLTNIKTAPLTDISYMLRDCTIESANLDIDTSNVDTFAYCFYGVTANNGLDLSTWRYKQGALLNNMFNASKFTDGKIINFGDTVFSNVGMNAMFLSCTSMTESPILNIVDNTEQPVSYAYQEMFSGCTKLERINYTNPWVLGSNTTDMFRGCSKFTSVPPITFLCMSGGNRNSISSIYYGCAVLPEVEIYINYVDGENLYMSNSFNGCKALAHIKGNLDLSNIANATYLTNIFTNCSSLEYFETTGSIAGQNTFSSATLTVSASPVFNISKQLEMLAVNSSGKTRIIKLHADVYNALTDDDLALATEKGYTLASA